MEANGADSLEIVHLPLITSGPDYPHHPTRPSAVLAGLRIIRCESRPRNTSDGR